MRETVQLFHDMLTKDVNQLLGDPNATNPCTRPSWYE